MKSREESIFNKLFSLKLISAFLKYNWATAKNILATEQTTGGGYNQICIFLDMIWCNLRYGAPPADYTRFQFYKLRGCERNRYVTRYRHQKMMRIMNKVAGEGKYRLVDNKEDEYIAYRNFINRDWLLVKPTDSDDMVLSFIHHHDDVIAKPVDSTLGRGVVRVNGQSESAINDILQNRKKHTYLLEECLKNCEELSALNPSSLNTIRAFTHICPDGTPEIFELQLRVGTPGMLVDNWGAGGIVYKVDVATGVIDRAGIDKHNKPYIYHPGSNIKMVGFEIPHFNELKDYIISLAKVFPKAKVVGWDIAITDKGLDFIEMNCPGGHDIMQAFGTPYYDKYLH